MLESTKQILTAAHNCFFQHGFQAASISMISRYANISRVTIHKQFKSKESLLREVMKLILAEEEQFLLKYQQAEGDVWILTEDLLKNKCYDLFEEIASDVIKSDLVHAGQVHGRDLITAHKLKTREVIAAKLSQAANDNSINLARVNISCDALAKAIELSVNGIIISSFEEDFKETISNLISTFAVATRP